MLTNNVPLSRNMRIKIFQAYREPVSADWRREQDRCLREIAQHQEADQSYLDGGRRLAGMARGAQALFEREAPLQKRRLLNFVVSSCTWSGGELRATFRQPFDLLAETTVPATDGGPTDGQIRLVVRAGWGTRIRT
jgi:site-specific DNA recombinase